jgi:hypothetical protein
MCFLYCNDRSKRNDLDPWRKMAEKSSVARCSLLLSTGDTSICTNTIKTLSEWFTDEQTSTYYLLTRCTVIWFRSPELEMLW